MFDIKLAPNPLCLYCSKKDTITHFFLFCEKIDYFWNDFFNWWNHLGDIEIAADYENLEEAVIFGFKSRGGIHSVLNYCILMAKYHIYVKRIHHDNAVDLSQYLVFLKHKLKIEKQICDGNEDCTDFNKFTFLYDQL